MRGIGNFLLGILLLGVGIVVFLMKVTVTGIGFYRFGQFSTGPLLLIPIGDFGRRIRFDSEGNLFDKEIELLTSFNGYDILSKNRERTLKIFEFHCFSFVWVL